MSYSTSTNDPVIVFVGGSAEPEFIQLDLVCRFYGFRLLSSPSPTPQQWNASRPPVLVVVHAAALCPQSAPARQNLLAAADDHAIPTALVGMTSQCDREMVETVAMDATVRAAESATSTTLRINASTSDQIGFVLRDLAFSLGTGVSGLEHSPGPGISKFATVGVGQASDSAAMLRISRDGKIRYLLTRTTADAKSGATWQFRRSNFGEVATMFLLVREVGGARCWSSPATLANLTIDDPSLREPYGCLSYPGLLEQMRAERFHTTIGFVPWNYDRCEQRVVDLVRANPEYFSIAVHGNNHDRYEFFRYEARPNDTQRAKPLAEHEHNIRQAVARMEVFREKTGLAYDRVMVFPHGVSPAATFGVLKKFGFWATSNYSNVPLDERPPADPAVGLRGATAEWHDFPALRRSYPHYYSDEAIAIDLFLGNPVMFMTHQDMFFDGIDAFNEYARRVNRRQPDIRWTGLGEISRHLHRMRWLEKNRCEVVLLSHHAQIQNTRQTAVEYFVIKRESSLGTVQNVRAGSTLVKWEKGEGCITFAVKLGPGEAALVEVEYACRSAVGVEIRRRGFRNHALRWISDFRDVTLSRMAVGRLLTRRYYRPGIKRPTLTSLVSRLRGGSRAPAMHPKHT